MNIRKFGLHSLRVKLLLSFLVIVILFAGTGAVGYRISLRNSYDLTIEAVNTSLRHINREAGSVLHEILDRALEVAVDPDLQKALRVDLPEDMGEVYRERLNFNNWLYYESIQVRHMDGLYVLGENGAMFHATYSFRSDEYRDADWYQEVVGEAKVLWIEPHAGSELGNNLYPETMSIAVPVRDRASTRVLGAVIAEVLMKDLQQVVFEDLAFDGILCLVNEAGQVIYMQDPQTNETLITQEDGDESGFMADITDNLDRLTKEDAAEPHAFFTIGGAEYIAVFSELTDSPWKLLCLVPSDVVLGDMSRLGRLFLAAGTALVLAGILLSVYMSSGIVRPIRRIQSVMKEVEKGDFTVRTEKTGEDEIGDLGRGLNHMIGRIDELMVTERETQEKLKKADFNALQSQINPHFLYNTLDSINWMARMGRTDQVEKMIDSLTSFLRIGLSRGRTFISLQEEIRHVESYFRIQEIRYHSLLRYEIDVPEELYPCRMIKMTLQPLVENALYHGIKEKDEPGTIVLKARAEGADLIITIRDDGLGMTPERLAQVREMMRTGEAQNRDAYGIINVQRRIRSYFGEEYGLHFDSEYRKGTVVTIILPKQETGEDHV